MLAYQTQINHILRSRMENKESVDAKRWLKMIDLSELWKACEGIIGNATQERLSFVPSCTF
jgi:hypothetical protein